MSLSANVKVSINATQTKTADFESASSAIAHALSVAFSDGVAAGQANRIWKDTRTLGASATEDLDFSGALLDIFGDAVVILVHLRPPVFPPFPHHLQHHIP